MCHCHTGQPRQTITSECFEDTSEQVSASCKIKHSNTAVYTGVHEAQLFQQWKYGNNESLYKLSANFAIKSSRFRR
jgi:hypothetical protein